MEADPVEVLTIGHSTLTYERFLALLRLWSVTAIADVRTVPFSRHFPQFNVEILRNDLRQDRISYAFLGEELGGRPSARSLFRKGVANYEMMAGTQEFERGLCRVIEGAQKFRIALMCSEHDPVDCHRCLLVGRALHERGVLLKHIMNTGDVTGQREIEMRLMVLSGTSEIDLFDSPSTRLASAYRARAQKVAFAEIEESRQEKEVQEQVN